MTTKFGLQVMRFDWPDQPASIAGIFADVAKRAEAGGFDSLWVMDHFFQMGGAAGAIDDPMLEAYTTLGYAAAITERIKLGTLVTGYLYRHPGILGKTISTLDVLSQRRAYLGIGAGWYEEEAVGLGVPYPTLDQRYEQLEETLQIISRMWADDRSPFDGAHFQLAEPINHPLPMADPHPPILIGGEGWNKTLRLVAQYADACNFFFGVTDESWGDWHHQRFVDSKRHLAERWGRLVEHCGDVGRDPADIEFTVLGTVDPGSDSAELLVDYFGELTELGVQHIIVNMANTHTGDGIDLLAEQVIPQLNS